MLVLTHLRRLKGKSENCEVFYFKAYSFPELKQVMSLVVVIPFLDAKLKKLS